MARRSGSPRRRCCGSGARSGSSRTASETFKLSKDPQFIEKVHDVVGLYLDPPERAVVLCVDEKSQIQALDRSAPILPMLPGTPERATHDDKRAGTSSLYAALGPHHRQGDRPLHPRHRAIEFKQFLQIDREVPADLDVHLVLDNSSTHKTPVIQAGWPPTPASSCTSPRHQLVLAEPRRALVRRTDQQEAQTRRPPLRPPAQRRHPRLDRDLERGPKTLRLDQDRRSDPRLDRPLLRRINPSRH